MRKEIKELEKQDTQELVDLLKNRIALRGRQVYKKKKNNINNIIKYKSRQVVQGFNQVKFLDYLKTFSTVCKPETYKLVFIIAISNNWQIL